VGDRDTSGRSGELIELDLWVGFSFRAMRPSAAATIGVCDVNHIVA